MSKVQFNVWLSEADRDLLKSRAGELGLSAGQLVIQAVQAFDPVARAVADAVADDHEVRLSRLEQLAGL